LAPVVLAIRPSYIVNVSDVALLPLKRVTVVPDVVTLATLLAADKFPAASFALL
jgi:hypothetical protein